MSDDLYSWHWNRMTMEENGYYLSPIETSNDLPSSGSLDELCQKERATYYTVFIVTIAVLLCVFLLYFLL